MERNWQGITLDFVVKLPRSKLPGVAEPYDSILVVGNRRSKYTLPFSHHTDRGLQFRSKLWHTLFTLIGCKPTMSSAYHPESDGQTERLNQTLKTYIRCFCNVDQDDWASLLPQAQFAFNNSYHESIGMSPFMANTGPDASNGTIIGDTVIEPKWDVPTAVKMKSRMEEVQKRLQECIGSAQQHYKKYADEKRRDEVELSVGDEALINTINMKTTRPSRKFEQRATGPYYIKKQISPVSFQVQLPPNLKIHDVFHIKLLQKYIRPNDPSRALPKPRPIPFEEQEGWEFEDIIDVKRKRNKFEYLVHWKGFPPSDRSWEPQSSLNDDELLREWCCSIAYFISAIGNIVRREILTVYFIYSVSDPLEPDYSEPFEVGPFIQQVAQSPPRENTLHSWPITAASHAVRSARARTASTDVSS
ncbi:hypothetical protein SeLEV6574_g07008 [Synchytrium endobioticum]|uniref:Chromo domain-containing protein n=1 Tax=Synchytrium endobioticum TaxID=286115 RepID=A0A507CMF7_9FUNG|nr:hypothetical protein SeLEV6574_g07008 [Synchytrium endobioticum]